MLMAVIKHIASKNADYGAAERYLIYQHDEFTNKPVLDEQGRRIFQSLYSINKNACRCLHSPNPMSRTERQDGWNDRQGQHR